MLKFLVVPGFSYWLSVVVADFVYSALAAFARSQRLAHTKKLCRQVKHVSLVEHALRFAYSHYLAYWQRLLFKVSVAIFLKPCLYLVFVFLCYVCRRHFNLSVIRMVVRND